MFICIKQQLSNIWGSVHEKLSNTEAELKKALLIKKTCIMTTQNLVNFSIQQALDRFELAYLGKTKVIYFHFYCACF